MTFAAIVGVPESLVDEEAMAAVDLSDDEARNAFYADLLEHDDMQERVASERSPEQGQHLVPSCETSTGRAYPPRRIVKVAASSAQPTARAGR